jgi:hypothetical protein
MKNKFTKLLSIMAIVAVFATILLAQTAARIRFARGASSATVKGTVGKYGKKDYVVGAKKSQTLTASVSSNCESVTLDVLYKETGESLTDEPSTSFENTLVSAGDYIISVQNSDLPACRFTLQVGVE